jgi:hypothetical protein
VFLNRQVIWLLVLIIILILLSFPRFNRNDIGIRSLTAGGIGSLGDSADYTAMTLYFRGEKTVNDLRPPYTYRPLVPFLAALLPLKNPMTAINLINLLAMILTTIFMYKNIAWLDLDLNYCIIGCGLFVVSFPTFYYATIGYTDPVLVCLLTIGLYLIFNNSWVLLASVIIMGTLVKETIIILNITLMVYLIFNRKIFIKQGLMLSSLMLLFFTVSYYFARRIIPVDPGIGWVPSFERLIFNMSRTRCWLSFLLTYGVPGILALFIFKYRTTIWFNKRFTVTATLLTGILLSFVLFGYSMLAAAADGRFIWTSYPFSVPLAVIVLSEIKNSWLKNKVLCSKT